MTWQQQLGYLLRTTGLAEAFGLLLLENVAILLLALGAGALLGATRFRRCAPPPRRIERLEWLLAASTVLVSTLVTFSGLLLYRADVLSIREDVGWRVVLDVLVLGLTMDLAMFALHRLAHVPALYRSVHSLHHRYDRPRPLTLFVLHPLETAGFGALWLVVIVVYSPSWCGMAAYLVLNVAFGVIGHLGREPFPHWWLRVPVLGMVATATFHAQHHHDGTSNYGFYTALWDRLFGTFARPSEVVRGGA
jgi:sterol desaturase/sphingolipid hydroxylase (fatty acid hydroxylase superfamily)